MKPGYIIAVSVLLISNLLFAQEGNGGTISGILKADSTGQPLVFVNVALLRLADGKIVTGAISDSTGRFLIHNVLVDINAISDALPPMTLTGRLFGTALVLPRGSCSAVVSREHSEFSNILDKDSWMPSSPDCRPNDFFANSNIESRTVLRSRKKAKTFRAAIERAFKGIDGKNLVAATDSLPKRLRLCLQQKGGYFEHLL